MYLFESLARAHGEVVATGSLKQLNEDFIVEELMPIQISGKGEHLWLQIRKTGCNTDWVARQLAGLAKVKPVAIGYAGLKDRHGITTQWFSIQLPGLDDPDLSSLQTPDLQVLQSARHDRKLKRGALSGNRFRVVVRNLTGSKAQIQDRLQAIAEQGVPNYFGEQRFGHNMDNLRKAEMMFDGRLRRAKRHQKSIYLSAARSWIFNQILSKRVQLANWNRYLPGDVFQLAGKSACFADDGNENNQARLIDKAIHPTGALWGEGLSLAQDQCLQLESTVASEYELFCRGLEDARMKQERRSLRLLVENLEWQFEGEEALMLSFDLPAGAYATMVLREVIQTDQV